MSETNHYWPHSLPPLWQLHSQGPLLPVPWSERERERETLGNAGHVSPRIWEMTKHNIEGGAGKFSPLLLTCQTLPLCYVLSSPRFWEKRDQRFPGSLTLSRSRGREGEDPGNEVGLPFCMLQVKHVCKSSIPRINISTCLAFVSFFPAIN